ncbi:hypothetical protein, partial [Escherichia coli]|uniref:hypothetical protein n=1 Tax=Escherichia coli TaxID=562 RepID=UPI001E337090
DGNGSHASTLKSPSYTKSVSWQHYPRPANVFIYFSHKLICSQSTTTVITGHFQYFIKLTFLAQMNSSSTNSLYG